MPRSPPPPPPPPEGEPIGGGGRAGTIPPGFLPSSTTRPLAWALYFNLVNLSQAWVGNGRVGLGTALAGLHGGAFMLALALLWWRDHAAVLHLWPRRRLRAAVPA